VSTIGKFEAGLNVNPDVQEEILMVLGMKNSLIAVRDERSRGLPPKKQLM
jgi:hypothetical protein